MIFNYTQNYQFSTRLHINQEIMETVEETKLLGTIITNDLKWDKNTSHIVKKAYARMKIIRKLIQFNAPKTDLLPVYIVYIKSRLEQSSNVWHSGLSIQNENDLERVQKVACKLILKHNYKSYENSLIVLGIETLKERREFLSLSFAKKCLKIDQMKHLFPPNDKSHIMDTRNHEHFKVFKAHTNRLQESPIIYMQKLLNTEVKEYQSKILFGSLSQFYHCYQ